MLTDADRHEISRCMSAVAAAMPGFRRRQGQRVMIAAVAKTFARCAPPDQPTLTLEAANTAAPILCANGGTGIGKSLAYSIPGAVMARRKGKKLVIATATVALQDQLVQRDLPLFFGAAGLPLTLAIAKARSRYVCSYRLGAALAAPDADVTHLALWKEMATQLTEGLWSGDRDTWSPMPSDAQWEPITTDRHACLGPSCGHARECCQLAARQQLRDADVIVANHDFVLADLAMGGGKLLPAPADTFYIFDEAHHLGGKAVAATASRHLLGSDRRAMTRLVAVLAKLRDALGPTAGREISRLDNAADSLRHWLDEAFAFFAQLSMLQPTEANPHPLLDFEESSIPEEFERIGAGVLAEARVLHDTLQQCVHTLRSTGAVPPPHRSHRDALLMDIGRTLGRIEGLANAWVLFLAQPAEGAPPIAKWVAAEPQPDGLDFALCASPVRADEFLRVRLWQRAAGVVLASANLATLGDFTHFRQETGLARADITCVDLPSPFDYPRQGRIEIPAMRHPPNQREAHTREVAERVTEYLAEERTGMLVLFTSRTQMLAVAARLPESLRQHVLTQGSDSKAALLARHKAAIDQGRRSAIFGLESFAEGVDLAGAYCTHVVITSIPFSVPTEPVTKALCRWIDDLGGSSFRDVVVPVAARKLEQRVGRLIRTETDYGRVTVLDTRLWDTRYGRTMLRGLPPFRIIAKGTEVTV